MSVQPLRITATGSRVFELVEMHSSKNLADILPKITSESFRASAAEIGDFVNFPFENESLPLDPRLGNTSRFIGNVCFKRIL